MTIYAPTHAMYFARTNHDKKLEQKVTKDRKIKRPVPRVNNANYH